MSFEPPSSQKYDYSAASADSRSAGTRQEQNPLDTLIKQLANLPGLGSRSARRIALHLLQRRETAMLPLAHAVQDAAEKVKTCSECGNLDLNSPCRICSDSRREHGRICVVAQVSDLWAIERTGAFKGVYYVLGGLLSALDGIGPEDLRLSGLLSHVQSRPLEEIILALSATVDGQSTAHYITDKLNALISAGSAPPALQITRLAHGVPVGGELDYLDDGTITTALKSRSSTA
ncbi:MAG: recombination mediator RecR [Alphaproteobacteria bacterium]